MPTLTPTTTSEASLQQAWTALAEPGGWFDGAERVAIAAEVRAARDCALCRDRKAALSPNAVQGAHDQAAPAEATLSAPIIDTIHRITSDPGRLSRSWFHATRDAGLRDEEVVEITGVAAILAIVDTYARGLGQPPRPLPEPAAGAPHRTPAKGAAIVLERGWVPMVDPDSAEGSTKLLFDGVAGAAGFVFNVARALTAVPEAARDFFFLIFPHYSTHGAVRDGGLDRMQVELLASTTSAYNDCFY